NLTELSISSTDIDSGIEYLPKSIKKFYCSADLRKEAEVEKIKQALKGKLPAEIEEDTEELFERSKEIQKDIHQFFEGYSDEEIKQLKDPKQIENYEK
ncbi:18031_t:CDS:1, partial [Racocetra persica]